MHLLKKNIVFLIIGLLAWNEMLLPRAENSHYKFWKFIQYINNHIFLLKTIFVFHTKVRLMLLIQL